MVPPLSAVGILVTKGMRKAKVLNAFFSSAFSGRTFTSPRPLRPEGSLEQQRTAYYAFSNVFNTVFHNTLTDKLMKHAVDKWIVSQVD